MATRLSGKVKSFKIPASFMKSQVTDVTPKAKELVRQIFAAKPNVIGLSSQSIYQASRQILEGDTRGATPFDQITEHTHSIHSMRYLKKFVLEQMADEHLVKKIHLLIKERNVDKDENGEPMDLVIWEGKDYKVSSVANTAEVHNGHVWIWRWMTDEERAAAQAKRKTHEARTRPEAEEEEEDLTATWRNSFLGRGQKERRPKELPRDTFSRGFPSHEPQSQYGLRE
ncbi:hypothetical protein WOLCODRAFT_162651 [Wolfiporia cocos MD-104 SS10]|uniref:Uncharacterized protein n=1 Tax=Wolfiporia cocos (strain MD-104) TaxID=742152 RepID=A0A2H3JFB1_WOLCO|nr:hypothetical protein WOLCODRAFT_162651 [Wolfiporia cocos MD-104 SS10]